MEIIITDLTRFSNPEIVCIAGINPTTGECIRPLPYIKLSKCQEFDILPGNVITGDFKKISNLDKPHVEDCNYEKLTKVKVCNSEEFEELLENDIVNNIEIVKDGFKEGKIRLNLLDNDGKRFSYLSITDLGFYNYAMEHFHDPDFPNIINNFIRKQKTVFLRVGLGREYQDGFWLQINGIYTFPNFDSEIRSYH